MLVLAYDNDAVSRDLVQNQTTQQLIREQSILSFDSLLKSFSMNSFFVYADGICALNRPQTFVDSMSRDLSMRVKKSPMTMPPQKAKCETP